MPDPQAIDPEALAELFRLLDSEPQPLARTASVRHEPDGYTVFLDADGVEIGSVPTEDYRGWQCYLGKTRVT